MAISIDKIKVPLQFPENIQAARQHSNNRKYIPHPYLKVARGIEQQYAKFMIDQMNKTVRNSSNNSNGQDYYKSLLNNQRVKAIVNNKQGLGLQKVILDQIYPSKFRNQLSYNQFIKSNKQKFNNRPNISMVGPNREIEKYRPTTSSTYPKKEQGVTK